MKLRVSNLILILTACLILVDTVNGVTVRVASLSISQPVKAIYLVLLAIIAAKMKNGKAVISVILIFDLVLIATGIQAFFQFQRDLEHFQWMIRANLLWLSFFVFTNYVRSNLIGSVEIFKIFAFVSLVLLANLTAGALGYGYAQYGDDSDAVGFRGFIYAGNEMSFLILVCEVMVLAHFYQQKKVTLYLLAAGVFFVMAILKATKTTILGAVLIVVLFPLLDAIINTKATAKSRLISFLAIVLVALVSVYIYTAFYSEIVNSALWTRIDYFIGTRGLIGALLSDRDQFALQLIHKIRSEISLFNVLFGFGSIDQLVEIDILDIFWSFGLIGVFTIYGFFLYILVSATRKYSKNGNKYYLGVLLLSLMAIGISLIAGHVMYSGIAVHYVGLAFACLAINGAQVRSSPNPRPIKAIPVGMSRLSQ